MKIGILGTGIVGRTLAVKLIEDGHEVTIGTRDVSSTLAKIEKNRAGNPPYKEWQAKNPQVKLSTFSDAATFGQVIFLTVHGLSAISAIDSAGKDNFAGKIVVDVTNPLDASQGMPHKFAVTLGNSLGEQIQRHIPEAKVVKAFNSIGAHIMVHPQREEGLPDLLIAGNDAKAKQWVNDLAISWGWNTTVDLGGIENSFWLETHAMLWILYGFNNNSWNHAFKFLRK